MASDSVDATPPQPDALSPPMEVEAVNVKVSSDSGQTPSAVPLSLPSKLAHLLAVVVAGVIALFVSSVLADGRSVIVLKPAKDLPRITDKKLVEHGLDYRADELLGPTYGVGLHHDSSGYTWTECGAEHNLQTYVDELGLHQTIAAVPSVIATDGLKHPVEFLSCEELQKAGMSAMVLGYIAEIAAALMIIFHGATLVGILSGVMKAKLAKGAAALVWFTVTAGFLIVIGLALGIMETNWKCDNPFIPDVTLSDHFVFTYGIVFGYLGYLSALLVFLSVLLFTSTKDGVEPVVYSVKTNLVKLVGGLVAGVVVLAVVSLSVAGAQGAFEEGDGKDESYNYCAKQKPYHAGPGDGYFSNTDCFKDGIVQVLEQAGANVTKGYKGGLDAGTWRTPINKHYEETDLCPVNVHWHLGAEHLSVGQFDEKGKGPESDNDAHNSHEGDERRHLASKDKPKWDILRGLRCHYYDETDKKYTEPYDWKYCVNMTVGETYEVHWPHSAAGACGTKWQYQTPFYDGVFCNDGIINILTPLNTYEKIGVQSQVFTIVNDEEYYYRDLFKGMIVTGRDEYVGAGKMPKYDFGTDIAMYTGSTTGTTRDNEKCSRYAPITWQVDRTCHLISASSFDTMCKTMMEQADSMKEDLYAHGARKVSATALVANNLESGTFDK